MNPCIMTELGNNTTNENISEVHSLSKCSNNANNNLTGLPSSAISNYVIARERMAKLGEAWAEEEELPGGCVDNNNSSSLSIPINPTNMNLIMSRQAKLRIAKKNSKLK